MKKYLLKEVDRPMATSIDYQKDLNPEQFEVVTKSEGPCLVLAGAGSGKTRTLIYRVAYLLEQGVSPNSILLVTFTNKAAREMKDRIEMLLKNKPKGLWCGTFHHVGNRSIRMYARQCGLTDDFGILDAEDSRNLIKVCIKALKSNIGDARFPKASIVQSIISYARNATRPIEDVIDEKYPYFLHLTKWIKNVAALYERRKVSSNILDYDDLLSRWAWLLENVPEAQRRFSDQFKYILVDEYQDTNRLQHKAINLLAAKHGNVLVVGDDAQSIYSFRAAEIRNILEFPNLYPKTKIYRLETNYRSTPQILQLANNIIEHNMDQFPKKLRSMREDFQKPCLIQVKDMYSQAAFIAQRVLELQEEDVSLDDMAVLFRAHYQSAELEMELTKRNIPYVVRGGVRFFEQAHIKDVLSYVKILHNTSDEISWIRALSLYRGIGPGYADKIFQKVVAGGSKTSVVLKSKFGDFLPNRAQAGFGKFKAVLKKIDTKELREHPDALIETILKSGYEDHCLLNFENAQDRMLDLKELANFAHHYSNTKDFLQDITLRESFKGETIIEPGSKDESLVLSTIHQAKGLEWDVVMFIGLTDGQFPHPKSLENSTQLEEERRLFYVATTRAKRGLYLIRPTTRYDINFGTVICRPSLFLQELPQDLLESWSVEESGPEEEVWDMDGDRIPPRYLD
ncbi:MAG: ATP-dependent helicase [Candidatus Omnitrophica bacterium]|nr:ATP-dependent helicase [Candidatus Omnitrophota bacterium]